MYNYSPCYYIEKGTNYIVIELLKALKEVLLFGEK
jgi:hypothetical protein